MVDTPPRTKERVVLAGRYLVIRQLGRGGMGQVLLVKDVLLEQHVALKLLHDPGKGEARERLVREVQIAIELTHPNIVRTFDFGQTHRGLPFFTMEYVEGESLEDRLLRGLPPLAASIAMLADVADALSLAHRKGVVHRDLKPANVMLADDGRVLLTDFGIARRVMARRTHQRGTILGTPHYMAPEQASDEPVGPFSDVYAFGVMLFELASGSVPFDGTTPMQIAMARLDHPPRRLREVAPGVDETLSALVARMLARDPDGRPTADHVARELRRWLATNDPDRTDPAVDPVLHVVRLQLVAFETSEAPCENVPRLIAEVLGPLPHIEITDTEPDVRLEGSLQEVPPAVRMRARLRGAAGEVCWSARFDATGSDAPRVVTLQAAEALRTELQVRAASAELGPSDVVKLRGALELLPGGPSQVARACALLDQVCGHAASSVPMVQGVRSMAHALVGCFGATMALDPKSREDARVAREVGRVLAPGTPENALCEAIWARDEARLEDEARSLQDALHRAPTHAFAQNLVAGLEVRVDRVDAALRRLHDGGAILPAGHLTLARCHALRGDADGAWEAFERAEWSLGPSATAVHTSRFRLATATGRLDRANIGEPVAGPVGELAGRMSAMLQGAPLINHQKAFRVLRPWPAARVELGLLIAEAAVLRDDCDSALAVLHALGPDLSDLTWLLHNPLAKRLHEEPSFGHIVTIARVRIERLETPPPNR